MGRSMISKTARGNGHGGPETLLSGVHDARRLRGSIQGRVNDSPGNDTERSDSLTAVPVCHFLCPPNPYGDSTLIVLL